MRPCKTVTEVDIHPAIVSKFLIPNPTALRKGKLLHHGGSCSPKEVRFHVFVMVKVLIQVHVYTEIRSDRSYAHYYLAPNPGDKFELRKVVVGFRSSDAWRSWRFSLRSLDLISVSSLLEQRGRRS